VLADINQTSLTQAAAIEKNKGLLQRNPYTYLKPEHAQTWEAGYKGLFFGNSLYANADVYLSRFSNFIAQANMNVPNSPDEATIPADLYTRTTQTQYRMYTNSRSIIDNFGFSAGLNYQWHRSLILAANTTF